MLDEYLSWKPYFEIVPMREEDCVAVAEIHGQRFARPWSDDEFADLLGQKTVFGALARQTNAFFSRPAGGFVLAREAAGEAEILSVAVAERYVRCGLGWRLMQAAMREAALRGAQTMFLEVDKANIAAVSLYGKLGFVTVTERQAYYTVANGTRSAALVMRRNLR